MAYGFIPTQRYTCQPKGIVSKKYDQKEGAYEVPYTLYSLPR